MAHTRKNPVRFSLRPFDTSRFKPPRFKHFFTINEVARAVNRDPSRIRKLERAGTIPQAQRFQLGKTSMRLWSPEQVEEIKEIVANLKPGRKPKK
jgi:hypothetical protein